MSASTVTLKDFFEGRRRKLFLKSYTHLKTKAGEERLKLELRMPMLNESQQGIPERIGDAFIPMAKDSSALTRIIIGIEYKGMTVEFFSNETALEPFTSSSGMASASGAMMCKFALVSNGEGEKREIDLHFTIYVPAHVALLEWARPHLHNAFFGQIVYSQSELEFMAAETEEADDDVSEEAEDSEDEVLPAVVSSSNDDIPW